MLINDSTENHRFQQKVKFPWPIIPKKHRNIILLYNVKMYELQISNFKGFQGSLSMCFPQRQPMSSPKSEVIAPLFQCSWKIVTESFSKGEFLNFVFYRRGAGIWSKHDSRIWWRNAGVCSWNVGIGILSCCKPTSPQNRITPVKFWAIRRAHLNWKPYIEGNQLWLLIVKFVCCGCQKFVMKCSTKTKVGHF